MICLRVASPDEVQTIGNLVGINKLGLAFIDLTVCETQGFCWIAATAMRAERCDAGLLIDVILRDRIDDRAPLKRVGEVFGFLGGVQATASQTLFAAFAAAVPAKRANTITLAALFIFEPCFFNALRTRLQGSIEKRQIGADHFPGLAIDDERATDFVIARWVTVFRHDDLESPERFRHARAADIAA